MKNVFITVKRSLLLNVKPRRYEVPQYADRVKQVLKRINTVNFVEYMHPSNRAKRFQDMRASLYR